MCWKKGRKKLIILSIIKIIKNAIISGKSGKWWSKEKKNVKNCSKWIKIKSIVFYLFKWNQFFITNSRISGYARSTGLPEKPEKFSKRANREKFRRVASTTRISKMRPREWKHSVQNDGKNPRNNPKSNEKSI